MNPVVFLDSIDRFLDCPRVVNFNVRTTVYARWFKVQEAVDSYLDSMTVDYPQFCEKCRPRLRLLISRFHLRAFEVGPSAPRLHRDFLIMWHQFMRDAQDILVETIIAEHLSSPHSNLLFRDFRDLFASVYPDRFAETHSPLSPLFFSRPVYNLYSPGAPIDLLETNFLT
jgi:hypothetical protein